MLHDVRGVALVEFAFVVPILIVLFVAGFQLLDATAAYRKVTSTVRTLADLTAQSSSLTPSQADTILAASRQVMTPYDVTSAALRISEVQIPANGVPVVVWSRPLNATAYTAGTYIDIPTAMRVPNTYLILSEISYSYRPGFASAVVGIINLSDKLIMLPRNSDSVPLSS